MYGIAMSRPKSSWVDIGNFASNVYQNQQLANQARMIEQQNQMMQQQMIMQQLEQMNKQLLIEKRKMLMRLHTFLDKVDRTLNHYPEYSLMMIDVVSESVAGMEISSNDFEEVADMQKANEITTRLYDTRKKITGLLTAERVDWASRMKSIVMHEEDELERAQFLLAQHEAWLGMKPQYDEIAPIHKANKKANLFAWTIGISLTICLLIGGAIAGGS